jgi:zinc protease
MIGAMRTAALLTLLALASPAAAQSAAPAAMTAAAPLTMPYTEFTLPNGLRVIIHEDHSVPIVTVNTWRHVGSAREQPGRTGFAHLFEHLMFMGSGHVPYGAFDSLLENVGGGNNASTGNDTTNYYIDVPSNALELALYLESDRMGYLLDAMTPETVDAQRDVVKNERRQRIENQPYGMASIALGEMMYPDNHPYHWPVIGYMDDLTAASHEDVINFFKQYYTPANTSLVVAGDVNTADAKRLVEKWFSDIKGGPAPPPMTIPGVALDGVQTRTLTDHVQLPRLYLAWLSPAFLTPGDSTMDVLASVMADGKNSRLYKRLVYDLQIAQSVQAFQASNQLSSQFMIVATPRPGHTADELKKVIDEEIVKLQQEAPTDHEVQRAINQWEASFYDRMENIGGFGGVADQMNGYYTRTGDPDWFNEDLARYTSISPSDLRAAAIQWLPLDRRIELTVVPEGK